MNNYVKKDVKDLNDLLTEVKGRPTSEDLDRRENDERRSSHRQALKNLVIFRNLLDEHSIIDRLNNIVNWMNNNLHIYAADHTLDLYSDFYVRKHGWLPPIDFPTFEYIIKKSSFFRYKKCIWISGSLRNHFVNPKKPHIELSFRNRYLYNQSGGHYQDDLREEEFFTALKKYVVNL
jgi:hypothetical protein